MLRRGTGSEFLTRIKQAVWGLLASPTPRLEEAPAYVPVTDAEELIDAERQAAIIRERIRRRGLS